MPLECASMRSMARWVLPVLVGPSTAVTPAPRARDVRFGCGEKEMAITHPDWRQGRLEEGFLYHNATENMVAVKH
jgi:hypothetical protein